MLPQRPRRAERRRPGWSDIGAGVSRFVAGLDRAGEGISSSIERHRVVWLLYFAVFYAVCTAIRSWAKPLWFDEIFTYLIARLPSTRAVVAATGLDNNPPLAYLLSQASLRIFGASDFAVRLPAMAGYFVMSVCLFVYLRRRCPGICAMAATLLPMSTAAYAYAYEARPYGLVLGFAAAALLAWQSATLDRQRTASLCILALSSAALTGSHYYGAAALLPLALGEAVRSWQRRRLDLPVWAALAAAVVPGIWLAARAHGAASAFAVATANANFLFPPTVVRLVAFYDSLLSHLAMPAVAALAFFALCAATRTSVGETAGADSPASVPSHEVAAAIGFCVLPGLILVVSSLTTGYFMDRYALSAVLGCSLLAGYAISGARRGRAGVALVFSGFIFVVLVGLTTQERRLRFPVQPGSPLYPEADGRRVAIANPLLFLQAVRYSPPEAVSRCVYLTDRKAVAEQPDLIPELVLPAARNWAQFELQDYSQFVTAHDSFWMVGSGAPELEWLPRKLVADGHHVELRGQVDNYSLYYITNHGRQDAGAAVRGPK